ncbi:hypothetical protein ES707_11344 [subsurface metagenome]
MVYTVTVKGDDIDASISITDYKSYQAALALLNAAYDSVEPNMGVV